MPKGKWFWDTQSWIEQLLCFAFRTARVLWWIRRNCQVRRREFIQIWRGARSQRALVRNLIIPQERCFLPLDVEMIVHLLTLEVLCPRAQWMMRRQCGQRKSISIWIWSVLDESLQHYGIKRNVLFTNRTGSTTKVNFEVTHSKRAIQSVHKGSGNGSMIVFTPDGGSKINCVTRIVLNRCNRSDIRLCVWQRSLRIGRGRQWWSPCQRWKAKIWKLFWNQFSCDTQRVLGTSLEPSTAGPWENAINSTGCSWWESKHVWVC